MCLQIQPRLWVDPEITPESKCGVSGNRALTVHYFVNTAWWNSNRDRKLVLGDPEAVDEVLHQHFAGVNRGPFLSGSRLLSGSRRVRHLVHLQLSR